MFESVWSELIRAGVRDNTYYTPINEKQIRKFKISESRLDFFLDASIFKYFKEGLELLRNEKIYFF
jgi:hypothetical protein